MTDLMSWLDLRMVDVPVSLRERIIAALRNGRAVRLPSGQIAETFRLAGEGLMLESRTAPSTYDTAMTLLAADALITYACEALAEQEPEKLAELR